MSEEISEEQQVIQRKIFSAIEKNDVVRLKAFLTEINNVNFVDENSMTPLQHAAYKGNKEIVQILLDQVSKFALFLLVQSSGPPFGAPFSTNFHFVLQ